MKLKLNNIFSWVKSHKIWSALILIVVIFVGYSILSPKTDKKASEFVLVERGDIREQVSVTGNVKAAEEVDLAFERGGRLAVLNVEVGDRVYVGQTLASVSNADLQASLAQARANLLKTEAVLGNQAEQDNLAFSQSKIKLTNEIRDAYTKGDDAIRNKFFSLFYDPLRYNANLKFITDNFLQDDLEEGKDDIVQMLEAWSRTLEKFTATSDLDSYYTGAKTNLLTIKDILEKAALAVNGLVAGTDATAAEIEAWKTNISSARSSVNTAIDSLTASYNDYNTASLSLKISGSNTLVEKASIEQAKAEVAAAEAELAKTVIRSPINGVVTDLPIKLGEIVSANTAVLSVISAGEYEIESFVPEADIAKVKVGNTASATLDAYGSSEIFETAVIKIDPAATIIDGVPTYKTTLRFVKSDDRIRAGMTVNLEILTAEKKDVLLIPSRAVSNRELGRYVTIISPDGQLSDRKIQIGLRGFDGHLEVVSGLELGEKISTVR